MYVAIEGIKGTGKSSVLAHVQRALESMGVGYAILGPYSLTGSTAWCDQAFRMTGRHWPDWAVARFYAMRSDRLAARVPRRCGLLIGDRSIVTSYVTRWSDLSPALAMDAVDRLERRIPLPDHVVLLDVPVDVAVERIRQRPKRSHGCRDEQRDRLTDAARAYRALVSDPSRFGLQSVAWHLVDATRPLQHVAGDVLDLVLSLGAPSVNKPSTKASTS